MGGTSKSAEVEPGNATASLFTSACHAFVPNYIYLFKSEHYHQIDGGGENWNKTVFAFLAMLVETGVVAQVRMGVASFDRFYGYKPLTHALSCWIT